MWDGIGDFLAMGGHGPWVWGAYGLMAVMIVAEMLLLAHRRRRVYKLVQWRARTARTSERFEKRGN